jgi:hypothetical protein
MDGGKPEDLLSQGQDSDLQRFQTPALNNYLFEEELDQDSGFQKFNDGKGDEPLRIKNSEMRKEMGMVDEALEKPTKEIDNGPVQKQHDEKEPTHRSGETKPQKQVVPDLDHIPERE